MKNRVLESVIEQYLVKRVKLIGGICIKLNPYGYRGIPDRLVVLKGGKVLFVELKRPLGGTYEPLQQRWHSRLQSMNHTVSVCKTKEEVDQLLRID